MELRHLRYFLAVAEELHFSRAAARLHVSQPPLSQQIRDLEAELGVELFHRTKRHVQLSEAGRVFLDEVRRILAQVDRAKSRVAKADLGEVGQLTVGTVTSVPSAFHRKFVQILRVFAKRYPDVHLEIRRMDMPDQMQALRDGAIHVGFVTAAEADDELAIEVLENAPLAVALPEAHRLTSRQTVQLREVAAEPNIIISRRANPAYHDMLLSFCRDRNCSINVAHEANTIHMSLTLVGLGLGVSLLSNSFRDVHSPGVVFRSLRSPVPTIMSGVAYRREAQTRTVRSFLSVLRGVTAKKPRVATGSPPVTSAVSAEDPS